MGYKFDDIRETVQSTQDRGTGSLTITRTGYLTPYSELPNLMADVLGGYRLVPPGYLVLLPAHRHPRWRYCVATAVNADQPVQVTQYPASQIGISGLASLDRIANPGDDGLGKGQIEIVYTLPNGGLAEAYLAGAAAGGESAQNQIDLASESWDFSYKSQVIPHQYYKWTASEGPSSGENSRITKTTAQGSFQLVVHRAIRIPIGVISKLLNTINRSEFRVVNTIFPPNTLKFEGLAASRRVTTAQGFPFYELTYKFLVQPTFDKIESGNFAYVGHRRQFNFQRGYWDRLVHRETGDFIFFEDEDFYPSEVISGQPLPIKGFQHLFNPRAL